MAWFRLVGALLEVGTIVHVLYAVHLVYSRLQDTDARASRAMLHVRILQAAVELTEASF